MSIAWSGVVLLVLLLPGFLFFVGLYFPEKFTREVVERSPLAQLAGTVLIAFLVHGALFLFNRLACGGLLPCIDLGEVLGVISLDGAKSPDAVRMVARALSDDPGWIFGYMLVASAMGTGLGWFTGMQVVLGPFRFLAQHRWVYDLPLEGDDVLTMAYVLSKVEHDGRRLIYRGFLKAFGLQRDGRFSYLLLTNTVRYYLTLGAQPLTAEPREWIVIGKGSDQDAAPLPGPRPRRRDRSYFAIEGGEISNVIFDRYVVAVEHPVAVLDKVLRKVEEERKEKEATPAASGVG